MKPVYLIVALAGLLGLQAQAAEKKMWAKSIKGQKAPELVVEKWITEKPDTEGKFVLIDFWATWCGPCKKAIPELNEFHEKYQDKLVVIGLSDEPAPRVNKMKTPKIEYYSAVDTRKRMKDELKVKGIPHVIVVSPDGIVRWEGFPLLSGHKLTDKVMQGLLDEFGSQLKQPAKGE